jgi:hypothetical protein
MKVIVALLCAGLLMACSSDKQSETEKLEGAIPQAQLQALEKAKSVEQSLLDADAARREKIDDTESDER